MRDRRFITEQRGGLLSRGRHIQLMRWACDCAEHVLPLYGNHIDEPLLKNLRVARAWTEGRATVGEARRASLESIAVAREAPNPTAAAVARAVGHAAATAHMADHCLGPVLYALKALRSSGTPIDEEMKWQEAGLPSDIKDLVVSARERRMGDLLRKWQAAGSCSQRARDPR